MSSEEVYDGDGRKRVESRRVEWERAGNQGLSRDVNADWEADGGLPNIRGRDMTPWVIAIQSRAAIDFCNKDLWCVTLGEESSRPCYKTWRPIDRTETLQNG